MEATIKPLSRRRIVTLATAIFLIMIVGIAYAAWTADGSGEGTANSTEAEALSIDGTEVVAGLFPGDVQDLEVEIENPNPYNVTVTEISLDLDETDLGDCVGEHDITLGAYTIANDDLVVAAHDGTDDGTVTVVLSDAVDMGHDSEDDCQGVTFDIDIDLGGFSSAESATADDVAYAKD